MHSRFSIFTLLMAGGVAFGCGDTGSSGNLGQNQTESHTSTNLNGETNRDQLSNDIALQTEDSGADFAELSASQAAPAFHASAESSADGGAGFSADRSAAAPSANSPTAQSLGSAEDGALADEYGEDPSEGEEPELAEMQWIQLSTDDSTSMASAQIFKANARSPFGLKAHEFINYYDPPQHLFAEEEFPETREINDNIRFGIKAHFREIAPSDIEGQEIDVENVQDTESGIDEVASEEMDVDFVVDETDPDPVILEEPEEAVGELEVLFQMQADAIGKVKRRNWNLFLCVDVSGSMSGEKMAFTIEALQKTLDHLKPGDRVSLTTFSSEATNIFTNLEVSENVAEMRAAMDALVPDGGTNMAAGLEQSYRLAQQHFNASMLQRVILFGDGAANVGQTDLQTFTNLTRINGSEGIYLSGVGVGNNYDFQRMDELTDAGKGAHIFLPNRAEVDLIFGDYFHKLVEVAADGIEIEASLPTGIALAGFSGEEVSFNPAQRLQNIVLATGDDMTFTAKFNVQDEAALDEPMSLKVTIRPLSTDEEVVEVIEVARIGDLIAEPGQLFERTRLIHRFGNWAVGGSEDVQALKDDLAAYDDADWGLREITTLLPH